jgi:hypothetical protein
MAELREIIQDRTQPLQVRIDAVKKLSQESREYNEPRNVLFSVIEPEDEDPNLRSARSY